MKYHLASHNGKSFDGKAQDVFVSVPWYPSRDPETWIFDPTGEEEELVLSREQLKSMLLYLMQNAFVQGGVDGTTHRLVDGIATRTNVAPEETNLYLLAYEMEFARKHLPNWKTLDRELQLFLLSFKRYFDDCFMMSLSNVAKYWFHTESEPDIGMYPRILRKENGTVISEPLKLIGTLEDWIIRLVPKMGTIITRCTTNGSIWL